MLISFKQLYASPDSSPDLGVLTEGVHISWMERFNALARILADAIAPGASFPAGPVKFPSAWVIAFLALLSKPPKIPSHPKALRPISLLDPASKAFGVSLAQRLRPYSHAYLHDWPRFSYLANRSTSDFIGKAFSHCSIIRQILQSQKSNVHRAGGLALSVDLSL